MKTLLKNGALFYGRPGTGKYLHRAAHATVL